MSHDSNNHYLENMALLAELRRTQPSATHVYVQRFKNGIDIGWVDIPVAHAEMTLKNHPEWKLLSSNKQMDDVIEKLFAADPDEELEIPPKPSEEVGASDSHAHAAHTGAPTSLEDGIDAAELTPPITDKEVRDAVDALEKANTPPAAPKRAAKKTHARTGKKRT